MSAHERPALWREMDRWYNVSYAPMIRAVATYIETHGLISTIGQPTPRSGPRLLALLEEEARRAEACE